MRLGVRSIAPRMLQPRFELILTRGKTRHELTGDCNLGTSEDLVVLLTRAV